MAVRSRTAEMQPGGFGGPESRRPANRCPRNVMLRLDVIIGRNGGRRRWRNRSLLLRERQRNRLAWGFLIPLKRAEEVGGSGHRRTGVNGRNRFKLRQRARHVEVRSMS